MSFTEAISDGFSKYVTFSGRSSRSAYWWWTLFALIAVIVGEIVSLIIGTAIIYYLVALALFLPGLAVAIRRLHDIGKSGWWFLIGIIPIIGTIILIIWYVTDSEGPNQYGAGPDGAAAEPLPAV
jgi:uncharacterized membrane protein YhaH (DUF805 family)